MQPLDTTPPPPPPSGETRRRVIVFADLAESVRLMQRHEADAIERWRHFAAQVRGLLLPAHAGRMVRMAGDGLLMEFAQSPSAVAAALALHEAIGRTNRDHDAADAMLLRIGIHVADVVFDEFEVYGAGVNLAARLSAMAQPGQTIVSATARDALTDGLHADVEDLGLRYVKHLDEPVRAFRVARPGALLQHGARLPLPPADDLQPAVAVVPFVTLPADPQHDALGHAMADEVIAALSRHAGLRVLSRTSTAALRDQMPDLPRLHQMLGASFLLTGRCYVNGARVRLNVELCELPGGQVLWAGSANADVDALFAGQDELVPHVVANVGRQVLARALSRVRGLPMDTLPSYTLYLGATGLMNSLVPSDFERAKVALDHLVERHPRQASPYAMLARWHVFRSVQGWANDRAVASAAAQEQSRRALDLDPTHAVALCAEGTARMNFHDDVEGARRCYLAALQSDPQEAYTWAALSAVHSVCGEHEAACAAAARALALSPLDPCRFVFEAYAAVAALGARQHDAAVTHAQASLRHHALHAPSHRLLVGSLWMAGRHADARAATQNYLHSHPDARVGTAWRRSTQAQQVWGGEFAEALHCAGVPL